MTSLAGSYREQRCALNLLKGLANDLKIPVVAVGTEDARHAIQTDPQVASRVDPLHLARSELEHDTLRQLKKARPRLLEIDEIHHLLACTPREQRAASNVLKFLSNELRVSIVALGTSEALHVMRTDPQIASRFQSCALPSWTANDDLRRFLAGFLQQLDVDGNDIVNSRVAIDYILDLTSGVTGRIVELVRLSARRAVRRDSRTVTIDLLQEAGKEFAADLGSERNVSH